MSVLPQQVVYKFNTVSKCKDPAAKHKALLDLGEALIICCEGMLFGEYRKNDQSIEQIERGLYNCATRPASLGVHWGFVRDLSKNLADSPLGKRFVKKENLERCSQLKFAFDLLKGSILHKDPAQRINTDLQNNLQKLSQGRNAPKCSKADFFDCFISIRNIFAHPDQLIKKTGEQIQWPLDEEYYSIINPLLELALVEVLEDLEEVFKDYPQANIAINTNKNGTSYCTIIFDKGSKFDNFSIEIPETSTPDEEEKVFVDSVNKLIHVQNYSKPPQVNGEMAVKIVRDEKKKQVVKLLEGIIDQCLSDEVIDETEFFSLRMTAQSGYMDDSELTELIRKRRQKNGMPEDFNIVQNQDNNLQRFNPWWLKYLSLRKYITDASVVEKGFDRTPGNKTYVHASLFREFKDYLHELLDESLEDPAEENRSWEVEMNRWQQGRMTSYLWARISPKVSPLGSAYGLICYVPEDGQNISIAMGDDRARLQQLMRTVDPQARLLEKISTILDECLLANRKQLLELNFQVGLYPKKWLSYSNFKCNFDALGGFNNGQWVSLEQYLADRDLYQSHYNINGIGPVALTERDYYEKEVNFDVFFKKLLSIYANVLGKIADGALTLGISLDEARKQSRIYELKLPSLKDDLKNEALATAEDDTLSSEKFDKWQAKALHQLQFVDYRELKNELESLLILKDQTPLSALDSETSESFAEAFSDFLPELRQAFPNDQMDFEKENQQFYEKTGSHVLQVKLAPEGPYARFGLRKVANGTTQAFVSLFGSKKRRRNAEVVNSLIARQSEWHFHGNNTADLLLTAFSGKGGEYQASFHQSCDESSLSSTLTNCLNQLTNLTSQKEFASLFCARLPSPLEETLCEVLEELKLSEDLQSFKSKSGLKHFRKEIDQHGRFGLHLEYLPGKFAGSIGFRVSRNGKLTAFARFICVFNKLNDGLCKYIQSLANTNNSWKLMEDCGEVKQRWQDCNNYSGIEFQECIDVSASESLSIALSNCKGEFMKIHSDDELNSLLKALK